MHGYFDAPAYKSDAAPLLPQRVIGEMMHTLPPQAQEAIRNDMQANSNGGPRR